MTARANPPEASHHEPKANPTAGDTRKISRTETIAIKCRAFKAFFSALVWGDTYLISMVSTSNHSFASFFEVCIHCPQSHFRSFSKNAKLKMKPQFRQFLLFVGMARRRPLTPFSTSCPTDTCAKPTPDFNGGRELPKRSCPQIGQTTLTRSPSAVWTCQISFSSVIKTFFLRVGTIACFAETRLAGK